MPQLNPDLSVLITGAAGYVASWIVQVYLEAGFTVHATVRDSSREDKVGHLNAMAAKYPGKLKLFEADLLKAGSFAAAMEGCEVVVHAASPFFTTTRNAQKELIEPALQGTRNVLGQVNETASVRRVVLTSSVVAVYGDAIDAEQVADKTLSEEHWNTTSSVSHQPYAYSKTVAERAAWELADAQERWDLVVINPAFVFGPALSKRVDGTSADMLCSMLNGKFKSGVPDLHFSLVDVREVAQAHLEAGTRESANGRHLLVADVWSMLRMAEALRPTYGESHAVPKKALPKWLTYLAGPFVGLSWTMVARNVGRTFKVDNNRSQSELGIQYRPLSETLLNHAAQLIRDELV